MGDHDGDGAEAMSRPFLIVEPPDQVDHLPVLTRRCRSRKSRGGLLLLLLLCTLSVLFGDGFWMDAVADRLPFRSVPISASACSPFVVPSPVTPSPTSSGYFARSSSAATIPRTPSLSERRWRRHRADAAPLARRAVNSEWKDDGGAGDDDVGGGERCIRKKMGRRRPKSRRGRKIRSALTAASAFLSVWRSDLLPFPPGREGIDGVGMEAAYASPSTTAAVKVVRTERINGRKASRSTLSSRLSPRSKGGGVVSSSSRRRRRREVELPPTKGGNVGGATVGGGRPSPSAALDRIGEGASRIASSVRERGSRLDPNSVAAGAVGGLAAGIFLGRAGGGSVLLFRSSSLRDDNNGGASRWDEELDGLVRTSAQSNVTSSSSGESERTEEEMYWERRVAKLVSAAEEAERRARDDDERKANNDTGVGRKDSSSSRWTAKGWTGLSTSAPGEERVEAIMASYAAAELRDGRDREYERKKVENEARAAEEAKAANRARVEALIGATAAALSPDSCSPGIDFPDGSDEIVLSNNTGRDNEQSVRMARKETDDLRRKFEAARTKTEALEAELMSRDEAERALRAELEMWRRMKQGQ